MIGHSTTWLQVDALQALMESGNKYLKTMQRDFLEEISEKLEKGIKISLEDRRQLANLYEYYCRTEA